MTDERSESREQADAGPPEAAESLTDLFIRRRERLRQMVRLRLDRRLLGRVDPSDVLQEAYLDVSRRASGGDVEVDGDELCEFFVEEALLRERLESRR